MSGLDDVVRIHDLVQSNALVCAANARSSTEREPCAQPYPHPTLPTANLITNQRHFVHLTQSKQLQSTTTHIQFPVPQSPSPSLILVSLRCSLPSFTSSQSTPRISKAIRTGSDEKP